MKLKIKKTVMVKVKKIIRKLDNGAMIFILFASAIVFTIGDMIANMTSAKLFWGTWGIVIGMTMSLLLYVLSRSFRFDLTGLIVLFPLIFFTSGSIWLSFKFVKYKDNNNSESRFVSDPILTELKSEYDLLKKENDNGWNQYYSFVAQNDRIPAQKLRESKLDVDKCRLTDLQNKISSREALLKVSGSKFNQTISSSFEKMAGNFFFAFSCPIGVFSCNFLLLVINNKLFSVKKKISRNLSNAINAGVSAQVKQFRDNLSLTRNINDQKLIKFGQPVYLINTKRQQQERGVRVASEAITFLFLNNIAPTQSNALRLVRNEHDKNMKKSTFRNYYLIAYKKIEKKLPEELNKNMEVKQG